MPTREEKLASKGRLDLAGNDEHANIDIDAWVLETSGHALAYALSLIRNRAEAEDIVQDCYGRLLAKSGRYDLPRDGTKLLFKAISNACINAKQRRRPVQSLEANDLPALANPETGPEHQAILGELEDSVAQALEELPVLQRAIVELRSLGHSSVEIAEVLEISQANARVLLHRARQTLAVRLRPFLEEESP